LRLSEILASEFSNLDDIIELVEQDAGLSTKLLHVANSATFAPAQPICTPAEAVQSTGVDIIKALMLVHQVFTFYENNAFATATFKSLWSHSLATANGARKLAAVEGLPALEMEECFLAGLLHDIGKLILAANAEREYRVAVELSAKASLPLDQAEMGVFAATHAHVGAYLLALWGVSDNVISAVELHQSLDPERVKSFDAALAIHLAQNLEPGGARKKLLNTALLDQLGLSTRLPAWEAAIAELANGPQL
jgi:putative nucleotidyltransferase with HDIG domain